MYRIQLDNFEGPLDLLLYFIRRDELDIYDIPIAKITKDFVRVIEEWKRTNLVLAGDFIVMASTLMRVKAKMMIPRIELDEDGDIIRDAAEMLNDMATDRSRNLSRQFQQTIPESEKNDLGFYLNDLTLYDLAKIFKKAIESRPVISQFELNRDPVRLEKQKELILKYFDDEGRLSFTFIIKKLNSRMEIVVTFLAVLDLVREEICKLKQVNIFGEIELIHLQIKS